VLCARLSWPSRQLLSARKYTISYRCHLRTTKFGDGESLKCYMKWRCDGRRRKLSLQRGFLQHSTGFAYYRRWIIKGHDITWQPRRMGGRRAVVDASCICPSCSHALAIVRPWSLLVNQPALLPGSISVFLLLCFSLVTAIMILLDSNVSAVNCTFNDKHLTLHVLLSDS